MTVKRILGLSAVFSVLILGSGCSSSGSPETPDDLDPQTQGPEGQDPDSLNPPTQSEDPTIPSNPVEGEDPTTPTNPVEGEDPTTPTNPVEAEDPTTPTNPVEDPTTPVPPVPSEEPTTPGSEFLVPTAETGSDADRLFKGINRQVAFTLLDLNTRVAEGTLTAQQNECLGAFDPALGEQLLAIDCERPLATGDVAIRITQASYYMTEQCNADIFNGSTENCIVQSARISIPTLFETVPLPEGTPAGTPNRPQPVAGMEIYYAIEGSNLRIESAEPALTGVFRCDLDLASNDSNAFNSLSCARTIELTANRFDALLPE